MSYAHLDDEAYGGLISRLRERLASAASVAVGERFEVFQGCDGIARGRHRSTAAGPCSATWGSRTPTSNGRGRSWPRRVIGMLDGRGLTVRRAGEITGIAAADFSRLRRARLGRFTVDRLMTILDRLDQEVEVAVSVRPRAEGRGRRPDTLHP